MQNLLDGLENKVMLGRHEQAQQDLLAFQEALGEVVLDHVTLMAYKRRISEILNRCQAQQAEIMAELDTAKRAKTGAIEYQRVGNLA